MTFYVFLVKISLPPFPTKFPRFTFQGLFSRNCIRAKLYLCKKKQCIPKFHCGVWKNPTKQLYPVCSPKNSIPNSDLILLMEEILHHLGCIKSVNSGKSYLSTGAGFRPSTVPKEYLSQKIPSLVSWCTGTRARPWEFVRGTWGRWSHFHEFKGGMVGALKD